MGRNAMQYTAIGVFGEICTAEEKVDCYREKVEVDLETC